MDTIRTNKWFDYLANITLMHLGFRDKDELGKEPLDKFVECKIVILEALNVPGTNC